MSVVHVASFSIHNDWETSPIESFDELARKVARSFSKVLGEEGLYCWAVFLQANLQVDVVHILRGNLRGPRDWGYRLITTPLREAIIWADAFFWRRILQQIDRKHPLQDELEITVDNVNREARLLERLNGLKIVGEIDINIRCHTVVFGKESWFNEIDSEALFYSGVATCFAFLETKYDRVEEADIGDIVVYGTQDSVLHFGRIIGTDRYTGEAVVESKFGGAYLVRHHLGAILSAYGDQVAFFRLK